MRKKCSLAGLLFVSWLVSGGVATAASVIENPNFDNNLDPGNLEYLERFGQSAGLTGDAWHNPDGTESYLKIYRTGDGGIVEEDCYIPTSQPGGATTGLWTESDDNRQHLRQVMDLTAGAWTLSFALASAFQDAAFTVPLRGHDDSKLSFALYAVGGWGTDVCVWSLSGDGAANLVSIGNLLPTDATWNTEKRTFEIAEDGDYTLEIMMQGDNIEGDQDRYALTNVQLTEVVPEPGTWAMLCGLGLIGGVWYRRRVR